MWGKMTARLRGVPTRKKSSNGTAASAAAAYLDVQEKDGEGGQKLRPPRPFIGDMCRVGGRGLARQRWMADGLLGRRGRGVH
jgi:hypothetical protein